MNEEGQEKIPEEQHIVASRGGTARRENGRSGKAGPTGVRSTLREGRGSRQRYRVGEGKPCGYSVRKAVGVERVPLCVNVECGRFNVGFRSPRRGGGAWYRISSEKVVTTHNVNAPPYTRLKN